MRLVERDKELAVLADALAGVSAGAGAGVAVVGEPGAGKSVLVEAACAAAGDLRILRSRCDPLATPRPLGPFRDCFAHRPASGDGPLSEECEAAYDALLTEPTVLLVEDVHWVDAASVEVLRFLLRRVEAMQLAVVLTYRDDEIGPRHSARALLGDLAALDSVTTLRLAPLSHDGVAALVQGSGLDAAQVAAVTGGNPFFVSEVAKEPGRPLPGNVRDAVLARTSAIDATDLNVLQLAAVAPGRLDDRVLPALGVDLGTLQRLNATGLLLRDQRGLVFRHELARLAVESTIPLGGLGHLHATLLGVLESLEPLDPAVLTHHAVAAADAPRAVRYARAAADEAGRTGAHIEAVAFLRIALAHLAGDRVAQRAALLIALANEQFTTGRVEDAIASVTATFPLWQKVGDRVGLASAHDSCGVFEYYNARRLQAETHADRAAELARDGDALVYGGARLSRAYMATLRNDFRLAHQCRVDGERLANEHGHEALAIRSRFVAAASDLALEVPNAREWLIDVIEQARESGLDELASTGYSNLCAADVEQRRLQAAERVLEEALAYSAAREIGSCHHWQIGVRSRLRFLAGRWSAALEDADDALTRVGMPLATFWPHLVTGLVQLRTYGASGKHLEAAWRLAQNLDEPLRRLPALAGLAEVTWLTGQPDERVVDSAVAELERSLASPAAAWSAGELAVWLKRTGTDIAIDPARVAEPFRLSLTGRHEDAASWWRQAGSSFEEAMTYADGPDPARRGRGIERLDLLGAVAVADRLRLELRQQGFAHVPPRPQARTRANPAGLTNRQLDVAKLVARGFSNAEISSRLFISPKTTEVHVTAVLSKLGVPNRRAVAVRADELGLA